MGRLSNLSAIRKRVMQAPEQDKEENVKVVDYSPDHRRVLRSKRGRLKITRSSPKVRTGHALPKREFSLA